LYDAEKLRRFLAILRPPDLYPKRGRTAYYQVVQFSRSITGVASILSSRKDPTMGDKGGKKNKDKNKKQNTAKQEQKVKGAQEKNRPKG
jgi:hypothetical protein